MLINQTLDKLEALGLFGMLLGVREQLESSQYLSLSFDERLGLLVDREADARDSRRLALRLKAAKLRQEASVEDIDFRAPRGLDRSVIMSLAQANWVTAHHNLLITGPTGAGKTTIAELVAPEHIAEALSYRAPRGLPGGALEQPVELQLVLRPDKDRVREPAQQAVTGVTHLAFSVGRLLVASPRRCKSETT